MSFSKYNNIKICASGKRTMVQKHGFCDPCARRDLAPLSP
jgi:hypothetical protein